MGLSVFYWVSLGFKIKISAKRGYLKKLQNFLIGLKETHLENEEVVVVVVGVLLLDGSSKIIQQVGAILTNKRVT